MFAATALVFFAVLRLMPRPWTADQKATMIAALVCALITTIFGIWTELRVWLPCWVMLSFTAVIGGSQLSDRDWLASLQQRKQE
jgi:xanthine/uracil permease